MSYNPHEEKFHRLCADVTRLRKQKKQCAQALSEHHAIDGARLHHQVMTLSGRVKEAEARHARADSSHSESWRKAKQADARVGSAWNPANWFSKEQEQAQRSAKAAWELVAPHRAELDRAKEIVDSARNALKESEVRLKCYSSFDVARMTAELELACSTLPVAEDELEALEPRWKAACERLAPLEEDLARAKTVERGLLEEIKRAERFEEMLEQADNGWERAQVHKSCESALGDGKPQRVVTKAKGRLTSVQANIRKRHERLQEVVAQILRPVERVVIDGNNLCYTGQQDKRTFIGFRALAPLVQALSERVKVQVVFDGGICGQMKMDRQQICSALDRRADVKFMKGKADNMVLSLAVDPNVYVISGDHFGEYSDKTAVREGRLFESTVAAGRVIVEAMDINLPVGE